LKLRLIDCLFVRCGQTESLSHVSAGHPAFHFESFLGTLKDCLKLRANAQKQTFDIVVVDWNDSADSLAILCKKQRFGLC